jgi:hypothetical protein
MDDEAADKMRVWYSRDLWHRIQFGPNVKQRS